MNAKILTLIRQFLADALIEKENDELHTWIKIDNKQRVESISFVVSEIKRMQQVPNDYRQAILNMINFKFEQLFQDYQADQPDIYFQLIKDNEDLCKDVNAKSLKLFVEHIHKVVFFGLTSIIFGNEEFPLLKESGKKYIHYYLEI
jgi:hypothetical protein